MPYPFAHPAAVLPLARPMGRLGVPSALAIGSVIPDFWYFVPGLQRADSHGAAGLLWFCLPLGLALYVLFHLLVKQPLVALLPAVLSCRLAVFASGGLPQLRWHAVSVSLLAGALTHIAWDGLVHSYAFHGFNLLQHASTLLGTAVLGYWSWQWLRRAPAQPLAPGLAMSPGRRLVLIAALVAVTASCAWHAADAPAYREALRQAWVAGMSAFGAALLLYCVLWRLRGNGTPPRV